MITKSTEFCNESKRYQLFPNYRATSYNCVTASKCILESIGIHFLQSAETPYDVEKIIENSPFSSTTTVGQAAASILKYGQRGLINYFESVALGPTQGYIRGQLPQQSRSVGARGC